MVSATQPQPEEHAKMNMHIQTIFDVPQPHSRSQHTAENEFEANAYQPQPSRKRCVGPPSMSGS